MPVGKMMKVLIRHAKSPGVPAPGLFYSVVAGWLIPQADYRLLFSVQPFAYVVGNYTCQNGE
ncbi:MAG: hypothetical protein HDQ98_16805 [Lachnospiraceae bacterium]|nr:hypothetical protein [Lachnospiraceae bacterium]